MSKKTIVSVIIVILVAVAFYFFWYRTPDFTPAPQNQSNQNATSTNELNENEIIYENAEYGFRFVLPKKWEEYSIVEELWEGYSLDSSGNQILSQSGPLISIRHPDWDYKSPRQDIPIMVFTVSQWNAMRNDEFHIGAAPINPTELARNNKYVFALPARYNFAFITGYEEVEEIIRTNPLSGFNVQ